MAVEWYLINKNISTSGDETDSFPCTYSEAFNALLESNISTRVEICNYDLSEVKSINAIIENETEDTALKTTKRNILLPIGSCKAGMYIKYKNRYWLIIGLVDDNQIYEKAVVTLCNYKLSWVDQNNMVHSRWANITSASQYNHGETGYKFYIGRTDQLLVLIPDDDYSLTIKTNQRFIIDRRCEIYEKEIDIESGKDTSHDVAVYRMTRADSVLFDYQDSGYHQIMVYQDEQQEDDGYYVIDDNGYWLCGGYEVQEEIETIEKTSVIKYSSLDVYNNLDETAFCAKFYENDKEVVGVSPIWEIESSFSDSLQLRYLNDAVFISVNDSSLINKTFILSLSADGYRCDSVEVAIRAFI